MTGKRRIAVADSPTPRVSVITVVRNDAPGLARTQASLASQDCSEYEWVVVDGGSDDGSVEFLRQHEDAIDVWISEPDEGIYHAMNKALRLADGEWLLFMNAGDEFAGPDVLSVVLAQTGDGADVVFSDWYYRDSDALVRADLERMRVLHQSLLYRRSLHETYGCYVVGKGVSISDYIFFLSIRHLKWCHCPRPIACCDRTGVSARPAHFHQRIAVELVFGLRSRLAAVLILALHTPYRALKRLLRRK